MALQVGQIYGGKYRVLRVLGEGFAGAVYEGENIEIGRRVALETLSSELEKYPEALARFQKEAEALGKLDAEHIGKVLDFIEPKAGTRCLVREFLEGMTLEQRLKERGRLRSDEASQLGLAMARGLSAAHEAGVVHRGVGPASAFLTRHGQTGKETLKLIAFGLFLPKDDYQSGPSHYAAPEQIKGNTEVDARTDVYATGVVLYECLTGQVPFPESTPDELGFKIVMQDPTPLEKIAPDVDLELATIVHKAMARDPRSRYQTAKELALALHAFRQRRGFPSDNAHANQASPPQAQQAQVASMSATDDDDDHDLGDHGTVVMNRKLPFIPQNASPRPLAAPPPPPHAALAAHAAMTNPGLAPAPQALPTLPPSITGLHPRPAAPPAAPSPKLVVLVAAGAFGAVFILGALLMLIFRLAHGPLEEDDPQARPASSASAATIAPGSVPSAPEVVPVAPTSEPVTTAAPASTTTSPSTKGGRSPSPRTSGGKRRISNDL